jgi:hypothetical protein
MIDLTNDQENKELNTEKRRRDFYIIQHYH